MKKWSTALLLMLLCAVAVGAVASGGSVIILDGIQYTVENGVARVTAFVEGEESVIFHASVNGMPTRYVPWEDTDTYVSPSTAKRLVIAEGVTELSNGAFANWGFLEELTLPDTLRSIGENAFTSALMLKEVILPEGIEAIGGWTFSWNDLLEHVALPSTLTQLGDGAFGSCWSLQALDVAEGNTQFRSVDGVVYSKDGKTLVAYPAGKPGDFVIPSTVEQLSESAFGSNKGLTGITVPEGVTKLADGVFGACGSLVYIDLPASLTELGAYAFPRYGALERINIAKDNARFFDMDGVAFERANPQVIFAYPPAQGLSYDMPKGVTEIGADTFNYNRTLTTLTIPRGVTVIPSGAFEECTALERVTLPITLTEIGAYAFSDCFMLEAIGLPPGLKTIGNGAFYNCPALQSIVIPDSVTEFDGDVFYMCSPDLVLYGSKDSAAYWYAWEYDMLWAEPGGKPEKVRPSGRERPAAVVSNEKADDTLILHATPSENAKSLGKYPNGTTVELLGRDGEWSHVRLGDGTEGYMSAKHLVEMENLTKLVSIRWGRRLQWGHDGLIGQPIKLYQIPLESAPSETVTEDVDIRILEQFGVWYYVDINGRTGYVLSQYLNVARVDWDYEHMFSVVANPNQRDRLHLRKEASAKSESLGRYVNGTQVEVVEYLNDAEGWCRVRVDGKEGYMLAKFLIAVYNGGSRMLWGNG